MNLRSLLVLALFVVFGCRDVHVPEAPPAADSTTQIDSVLQPGIPPDIDIDCARSLCGCWEDRTLSYANTVADASTGEPLHNITLTCVGEDFPIGISDEEGGVAFEIETQFSPGCNYARCRNLRFEDPAGAYEPVERTVYQLEAIEMERIREN